MAVANASSSRSLATACLLAVLLVGCMAAADARRLLVTAMPPAADEAAAASPALAPAPELGADHVSRMLFEGRGLLDGGLRLAGRLLLGLGL
uniref:Uncharacterized protein n=1 Tax=Arundo donax TaxID=35708 RepID=A0A0A8ZKQ4_ARUDO